MAEFRHYLLTRFNAGLYGPNPQTQTDPREWMDHRVKLFTAITLPSVAGQNCREFTWLILMDGQTPESYIRELERLACPTMRLIVSESDHPGWQQGFAPGRYDLITTRIDNDDALYCNAVREIQDAWRARCANQTKPWGIVFPFGLILDLSDRRMWVMEYWCNNCPTLVEDSRDAGTVYRWPHDQIPQEVPRHYIKDKPYWLQVIHSQNLLNAIDGKNPLRIVHKELPAKIEFLRQFGINPVDLPSA